MTMSDMGETDFAVIVYREEDQWEADALPAALTADPAYWGGERGITDADTAASPR